jgi:hypothetical protein
VPRRFFGLSIILVLSACGGETPPAGITAPGSVTTLDGVRIATTHLFGAAPDKTTVFGPAITVVGPGVELRNFGAPVFVNGQPASGFIDIDFSATSVLITVTRDQPFAYFDTLRFSDADGTLRDFAVRVNPATTYTGFNGSRIRLEPDVIDLNLTGLGGLRGQAIVLDATISPSARKF